MTQPHSTISLWRRGYRWLLPLLLSLALSPELQAATLTGRVTAVPNGQQIMHKSEGGQRVTIALAGIRSPTIAAGQPDIAQRRLHTLLAGRQVTVKFSARSRSGVIIGRVLYGGADISLRMLRSGLAQVTDKPGPLAPDLLLQYQ